MNAVYALESVQAFCQREEHEAHEAAARAATDAQVEADREASRQTALENTLRAKSEYHILTIEEHQAMLLTGLAPAIQYIFEQINSGGDQHIAMESFGGARIFDPSYAKTLTCQ